MRIRFVNHACVVFERAGVSLICDPWLYGSAFNHGWDLVCESPLAARELGEIRNIWFSHEHPDHFSPRVLMDVPEALRPGITVYYSASRSPKLLRFCEALGYRTRSLIDGERQAVSPGLTITCYAVPLYDSALLVEADGRRALNLNDAVVESRRDLARLRRKVGRIDVLLTQFSYAAWRGNPDAVAMRQRDAQEKLRTLGLQVAGLAPRYTMPFASMAYFSHAENAFMNDATVKPWEALPAIQAGGSTPRLLYPGDTWEVGAEHDNGPPIASYRQSYAALGEREPRRSAVVDLLALQASGRRCIERTRKARGARLMSLFDAGLRRTVGHIQIHLWDLGVDVRFSFEEGVVLLERRSAAYDLSMGSDSLQFLLEHPWGIDTLTVNGRFRADAAGLKRLLIVFGLDLLQNAGVSVKAPLREHSSTVRFLVRILARKLRKLRAQGSPAKRGRRWLGRLGAKRVADFDG